MIILFFRKKNYIVIIYKKNLDFTVKFLLKSRPDTKKSFLVRIVINLQSIKQKKYVTTILSNNEILIEKVS